jgi:hypothetical protein
MGCDDEGGRKECREKVFESITIPIRDRGADTLFAGFGRAYMPLDECLMMESG